MSDSTHFLLCCTLLFLILSSRVSSADEISSLQTWLDNKVTSSKNIVGLSSFLAAGGNEEIYTFVSGKSVLKKAWDTTKKRVVRNTEQNVEEDTTFMMASVTKTIVWTALSMVYDAGYFELDDPINDVLPFTVRNPRHKNVKITYRMIYAHTTGIKDSWNGYRYANSCPRNKPYPTALQTVIKKGTATKRKWYNFKPGNKHEYSNYGTALAGLLVEKHTGMELSKFIQTYIFDPLGMTNSKFYRHGNAAELYEFYRGGNPDYDVAAGGYCFPDWPSGQLWSTGLDLGKFARAMMYNGRIGVNGNKCLYDPETTGKEVFEHISKNTGNGDSGFGWFIGRNSYTGGVGHDGSETGVTSNLYLHLDDGVAIGWVSNSVLTNSEVNEITKTMMDTAKALGSLPIPDNDEECEKVWDGST